MRRLAPLLVVAVLAGCGGSVPKQTTRTPKLPRALATAWRGQADGVAAALAAGDGCTAEARAVALQTSVIHNVGRIAPRFRETLLSAVNELAARVTCTPPAPVVIAPTPAPSHGRGHPKPPKPHDHGHGHGHGHKDDG